MVPLQEQTELELRFQSPGGPLTNAPSHRLVLVPLLDVKKKQFGKGGREPNTSGRNSDSATESDTEAESDSNSELYGTKSSPKAGPEFRFKPPPYALYNAKRHRLTPVPPAIFKAEAKYANGEPFRRRDTEECQFGKGGREHDTRGPKSGNVTESDSTTESDSETELDSTESSSPPDEGLQNRDNKRFSFNPPFGVRYNPARHMLPPVPPPISYSDVKYATGAPFYGAPRPLKY